MNLERSSPSIQIPKIAYIAPVEAYSLPQPANYLRPAVGNILPLRTPPAKEPSENLILRGMPISLRTALEPFLKQVSLTKHRTLYREDDRLDFVYFPGTAVVSEFRVLEDGRIVEVAVMGRDGAVGLSSFLLGSDLAGNTAEVTQTGTAERIPVWALTTVLDSNPEVRPCLNPFAARYARQISQKVICNMYHSAKGRLCTWLLTAQDWSRSDTVSLTHEQIARILGVFRPTVTCIAQELRQDRLITYARGEISINDRKRLQHSACACYLAPGCAV